MKSKRLDKRVKALEKVVDNLANLNHELTGRVSRLELRAHPEEQPQETETAVDPVLTQ